MDTIGSRIKFIRKTHRLSQCEFANRLRVTQCTISYIENEITNPSKSLIRLISILFKVNESWIIHGK